MDALEKFYLGNSYKLTGSSSPEAKKWRNIRNEIAHHPVPFTMALALIEKSVKK